MAYVNVVEWKTEQVCEWLKGLDDAVLPYVHSFMNHGVNGQQLLNLRSEDLEHLGVLKLGHQEIILEAVEYLRNFHYELDRENLQLLALRLSCQAHSLYNELSRQTDSRPVTTQTLSDVASVIMTVKPLVRWLDRPPFSGQLDYNEKKMQLMKLSLEMATCAQRDRFADKPIEEIRSTCEQLAKLADYIIQDIADPMILQPVTLDLATLKKRPGDELGFCILPSFHGIHQIAEIKFGSAAHQCGKMEEGDEIVQINYQTVVGWERKSVLELFRESPNEILLTLKRRPRHTKVYGQIYIKPYRLPSNKKTSYTTRWQHNLPSPRPELLTIPDFTMPLPRHTPKSSNPQPTGITDNVSMLDTIATDSSGSDSEAEPPLSVRLYSAKPRSLVQRRATITGASPTTKHGIDIEQFWKELKQEHSTTFQLRDKAASCAHSLDSVPSNLRPQTCLGIEQTKRKKKADSQTEDKKVQFQEKLEEKKESEVMQADESKSLASGSNESNKLANNLLDSSETVTDTTDSNNSDTNVPLDECNNFISDRTNVNKSKVNVHESNAHKERGKLDKSYSAPAYDLTDSDDGGNRKLAPLENHLSKLNAPALLNTKNVHKTEVKPDVGAIVEKVQELESLSNKSNKSNECAKLGITVNVAEKIDNIERNIRSNENTEFMCVLKVPEQADTSEVIQIKIQNMDYECELKEEETNTENNSNLATFDKNHVVDNVVESVGNDSYISIESNILSCETKEDRCNTESTSSSSSEGDAALKKFGKILKTIDYALTEQAKVIERQPTVPIKEVATDVQREESMNNCQSLNMDNSQELTQNVAKVQTIQKMQSNGIKHSNSTALELKVHSCRYIELPKVESAKKLEIKAHLTPPEPPPRKYISKPEESKLINNLGKPQVPVRHYTRRELKRIDGLSDNHGRNELDYNESDSCFNAYPKRVEKPIIDYKGKVNVMTDNQKTGLLLDSLAPLSSECNDKQLRDERLHCEKYEPFVEKFANVNQSECCYKSDNCSWNNDSFDSSSCIKQDQSLESKSDCSKLSEKDKSFEKVVVNKAIMVARSIGLHGGLSKSSGSSPRSNRKRNTLLAKKRNISVKDLGTGDIEGWLTYRSRGAGGAWARAWFVLKRGALYRFKMQSSPKADCLIALTGFTVSQAAEVKSRKYAFKVYHTGTVFYFAADTEDCLTLWLDAVNKATLGADTYNHNSAIFSETDESDSECKNRYKPNHVQENKSNTDKSFGSLKKVIRKDSGCKDHEIGGASLDRKYLRFLGTRNQNVPVPTAQFRSYRRVLPTATTNKKEDCAPSSPDLQMTIAGSTFYGLSASQSAMDMSYNSQDMGDYRRSVDRCNTCQSRRQDDLQGFITLEQFMLSQQEEERRQSAMQRSMSPRVHSVPTEQVHMQHRNLSDTYMVNEEQHTSEASYNNGIVYNQHKNSEDISPTYGYSRNTEEYYKTARQSTPICSSSHNENRMEYSSERSCRCRSPIHKKPEFNGNYKRKTQEVSNQQAIRQSNSPQRQHATDEFSQTSSFYCSKSDGRRHHEVPFTNNHELNRSYDCNIPKDIGNLIEDLQFTQKKFHKNEEKRGSSGDLTYFTSSETLQRAKKEATISRKGSFNLANHSRDYHPSDKRWLDSLRCMDKKNGNSDKSRLKNAAQYQPPPIPASPFEQESMKPTFEMHLDKKEPTQKTSKLKNLFSPRSNQKPSTLDIPKDHQKTLLGSPRLHKALFWERSSNQHQYKSSNISDNPSPSSSASSQSAGHSQNNGIGTMKCRCSSLCAKDAFPAPNIGYAYRCNIDDALHPEGGSPLLKCLSAPKFPYVPPPTYPPPDYPDLEYPPVFEPGTYSLSDVSLLRIRNKSQQNNTQ